jgi:excisionase family DNA binding protein
MTDHLLTADELAVRWRVKVSHVYRLTRGGELPAVKLGRYYRYRVDAIERFERDGGVSATSRMAA